MFCRLVNSLPYKRDFMHSRYGLKEILQNSSPLKPMIKWSEFGLISQDVFLGDPFQKLFAKVWSVENMAADGGGGGGGGAFAFCGLLQNSSPLKPLGVRRPLSIISLNINSSKTAEPIWTKLGRNVSWVVLFKNCQQNLIPSKTPVVNGIL